MGIFQEISSKLMDRWTIGAPSFGAFAQNPSGGKAIFSFTAGGCSQRNGSGSI
jgi:hypothetical protein